MAAPTRRLVALALGSALLCAAARAPAPGQGHGACGGALGLEDATSLVQTFSQLSLAPDGDADSSNLTRTSAWAARPDTDHRSAARASTESCLKETIPWLQIGFAMDCTGSTQTYLDSLKKAVYNMAVEFTDSVDKLEMTFLCYRDEVDTSPPRYEWAVHPEPDSHWFSNPTLLQSTIAPFYSTGGGDLPEDNAGAMGQMLHEKLWDPSAMKLVIVISKDKDSKRDPYNTDASQCQLMKDFRSANIKLVLGHLDTDTTSSMLYDSTYKLTSPWRGCYAEPSDPHQLKEIQFMGVTGDNFGTMLIEAICDTIDEPSALPTPSPTAQVTGDPHVTNVDGERFNIIRAGVHELLRLPRRAQSTSGDSDDEPLLSVMASVEWDKGDCNDPYVKEVELKGWWLRSAGSLLFRTHGAALDSDGAVVLEVNGSRLSREELAHDRRVASFLRASVPGLVHAGPGHKIRRARFLAVQLRLPMVTLRIDFVNRAVPGSSINHLNFIVSDLRKFSEITRMDIGGLLGRDAHSWASSAPEGCAPQQGLLALGTNRSSSWDNSQQLVAAF